MRASGSLRTRLHSRWCSYHTNQEGTVVGEEGLEPSASASRTLRATKLRHSPAPLIVASRVERVQCGGIHADTLNGGYWSVASKKA